MLKSYPEKKLVKVISPLKLDPKQIEEIKKAVVPLLGIKEPVIENIVKSEIIGGIIIEFGSKVIDLSIIGNIEEVSNEITSN